MNGECEPWNNSYQLDGETERLLRQLQIAPMTDDQIARSCLNTGKIASLLSPAENAAIEKNMIGGLAKFTFSSGKSAAFSDAIFSLQERAQAFRQQLDWAQIPPHLHELSRRRAEFILNYATTNGWLEPQSETIWRITAKGRQFLDGGGFYMR